MSNNRIITFTGLDRTGKFTQSKLLEKSLQPSKWMTSPDYSHWSGQLIRAILYEEEFSISRGTTETGAYSGTYRQSKHPEIFQNLQCINRISRMEEIRKGLESHHWIMDRYDVDALAFGLADGCELDWLLAMHKLYIPSDICFVFTGPGYERPGLALDTNETNNKLLAEVEKNYTALTLLHPDLYVPVDVEVIGAAVDKLESVIKIHLHICKVLVDRFPDLKVRPCSPSEIRESSLLSS